MKTQLFSKTLLGAAALCLLTGNLEATLGKNCLIKMADQSTKYISAIKVGDRIATAKGATIMVSDVRTGRTEILIAIQCKEGKEIRVSKSQMLATTEGLRRASELKVGDKLRTETGAATIETVYERQYNDVAFDLNLDRDDSDVESQLFLANGFFVGSNQLNNSKLQRNAGD